MPRLSERKDGDTGRVGLPFYWKLSGSYAAIVLLGALLVGLLVRHNLSGDLRAKLEESLRATCLVLEPHVREELRRDEVRGPELELRELGLRTGIRLTLIDQAGLVLSDTHADARLMENHGARLEVVEAHREGFGKQERASSTIGREMLYVAHRVEDGGETLGVIRAALPLDDVRAQLARVDRIILMGAAAGAVAAALCGLFVARRITRPITAMTETAQAVRAGDYEARTSDLPRDEIGVLGEALNELSAELTHQLSESSAERARLHAVLAAMVEGVVALDHEERVIFSNRTAREFLSVDPGQPLEGRLWEQVRVARLGDLIRRAREEDGPARAELSVRRGAGELLLDAHAAPFGSGATKGFVLVLHDVTELRRLEIVRRDFVANVSHELKTPLTAIQGFVETLLSGAIHDEQNNVRFLRKVEVHVGRLVHLVSDLLSLARIESTQSSLATADVDLGLVVTEVVRERGGEAQKRGQILQVSRGEGRTVVRGDRDGLFQVIGNLVENAIKYSPVGEKIEVAMGRDPEWCWIEVRDHGIGIPAADVDRVFERFYRVDKARSRELGGTGLGLSIVKNLVAVMGGRIHLESRLGEGSTFRVELQPSDSVERPLAERSGLAGTRRHHV